jgi:hypothetical protein
MDAFDSRRNPTPTKQPFQEPASIDWPDEEAHRVLVVIDAGKDLSYTALDWTLDHVLQCGDTLKLLGVLQQISTPSKAGFQAGLSKCKWLDQMRIQEVTVATILFRHLIFLSILIGVLSKRGLFFAGDW